MRLIVLCLLMAGQLALAQSPIEPRQFNSELQETRYRELIKELRCTVCQNEPLESSNAMLAADLRQVVYEMIMDGRSDFEVRQHMRDRYGDFVLYDPPFAGHTMILWLGPLVLLLIGIVAGAVLVKKRRRMLAERRARS
ncbi:MAG: cytochrome c-type biogenesis protein [Wenzhouxiangellaceae bacterium]|nr:cytochrome c-type biogenesis protein [Wenzhouxiangellaceae bacterium]